MHAGAPVQMVPSTTNKNRMNVWYSYFGLTADDAAKLPMRHERDQYHPREPVYTMPISVKPKTREPTTFTDNRIYVSNIPFSFREQDLAAMFYPYGRVLSVEIVTNDRGSKGFGFVTLDSVHACESARAALHESHVQGRIIEVRRATPTRRKVLPNSATEVVPPPKLCVDLRAPHSTWRVENLDGRNFLSSRMSSSRFDLQHMTPQEWEFHEAAMAEEMAANNPYGAIGEAPRPRRCTRHSQMKLSANGEYFLSSGEPTTDHSILMCVNDDSCTTRKQQVQMISKDGITVFPNQIHIHEQIASLLDTTTSPKSFGTLPRASSAGTRTSESEVTSDDEHAWTPNRSPDLLASLYEGSTSFHAPISDSSTSTDLDHHHHH
ncbi:unnamed protein product [Caenorhabditis auriculariae]|uniref:RRM domain-containing protein n=1 Tax=Caenorhabditis auriculariae TaxID=2777116 RepID=A0A8S1HUB1_9PELO|nr:unnamed protein product [Caenorhabditis auriculariae]